MWTTLWQLLPIVAQRAIVSTVVVGLVLVGMVNLGVERELATSLGMTVSRVICQESVEPIAKAMVKAFDAQWHSQPRTDRKIAWCLFETPHKNQRK